jgi:hypothetical protein
MLEESPSKPTSPPPLASDEVADPSSSTATPDGDTTEKGAKAAEGSGGRKTFSMILAGAMAGCQKGSEAPGAESSSGTVAAVPMVPVVTVVPPPGFLIEASGFGVSAD